MAGAFLTRRGMLGTGLAMGAAPAAAQVFPDRPLRLVVPYSAGGGTDVAAREIARHMSAVLDQPVIVENRSGANTAVGAEFVARSRPDGYTLYFAGASSLVVPPLIWNRLPYKPADFAPVSLVLKQPYGLGVNPQAAATLQQLVERMRAKPDTYAFGHTGTGGIGHLLGERLMAATGTRMISVSYRGFQQTVLDVITGRIAMTFESANNFLPFYRDGRVSILAVSSDRRLPLLPEVPTFAEAGYPDMVVVSWLAVYAPAGTPDQVIACLNQAVVAAVESPEFRRQAEGQMQVPESSTPEGLAALTAQDIAAWRRVIEPLNLRVD
ncbi:tripartite tricarboxylate transporter substrate binding protein [Siccirubricoccus sp. G192]|uniref:Bug family tripartite tricarboxylate transporter substrate binding protein n=1 Tax=Siccirubricoccus sp. G192 TaxID=2849651 RepID=UPI001C2BEAF3|nr:tripartite tricarboxylate transporter substrate binding protein [Siccirubricoccus sp. G192]MBV1799524.1 tripartite tricarboxylate transporter substrate binding protein [Siccirubricoccus sp. G192]